MTLQGEQTELHNLYSAPTTKVIGTNQAERDTWRTEQNENFCQPPKTVKERNIFLYLSYSILQSRLTFKMK